MDLTPEFLQQTLARKRGSSTRLAEHLGLSRAKVSLIKSGQRAIKDTEGQKIRDFLQREGLVQQPGLAESGDDFDTTDRKHPENDAVEPRRTAPIDLRLEADGVRLSIRLTLDNVDVVRRQIDLAEQMLAAQKEM